MEGEKSRMDDTDASGSALEDEFTREPLAAVKAGANVRTRRSLGGLLRPLRQPKLRRALLAVGGVLLLAMTLLVATGTAETLRRQARFAWLTHNAPTLTRTTITPQSPGRQTLPGAWQRQPQVTLPTPSTFWYLPAPDDPNTLYTCSASQTTATGGLQVGPLTFWYSHDVGQRWSSVRLPQTKDTYCSVTIAPDNPRHILLQGQLYSGCTNVDVFLSADSGAHWYAAPSLPDAPVPDNRCNFTFWLSAHHLFLNYNFTTSSGSAQNQTVAYHTSLWRSDDGGQTWKQLDTSLPPGSDESYNPELLDDGETLLVYALEGKNTQVWVSHDAGDSWEPWGDIQSLELGWILPPPGARSLEPTPAHPLYLLSGGATLFRIQIAQITDTRHWQPLPPLPIAGASPVHLGITSVLTMTPSGQLLVFGLGPDDELPADETRLHDASHPSRQWLWEWNPQVSQWTLLSPVLDFPWPEPCSDTCWHGRLAPSQDSGAAGADLWVSAFFANEPAHWTTFHIALPDAA